jgi:hypothetical protein
LNVPFSSCWPRRGIDFQRATGRIVKKLVLSGDWPGVLISCCPELALRSARGPATTDYDMTKIAGRSGVYPWVWSRRTVF